MKKARFFLWPCCLLLGTWLLLCGAVGITAVEWTLHPGRRVPTPTNQAQAQAIAARNHASLIDVLVIADDGVPLRGWSIRPGAWNGNAVILLHGQGDNRAGMLGNANLLLEHGYSVLLPDARAHGASGGSLATYGVLESGDMRHWFSWLRQSGNTHCIDGLGDSMGAAQLLTFLREESGFCAVVAESAFASFREASYERLGQYFHSGPWVGQTLLRPAVEIAFLYTGWRYGIDLGLASPQRAVARSNTPVLLIHGRRDTNLPPRHSQMIVAARRIAGPEIVLWEPEEAGHCGTSVAEPEEYKRRLLDWFLTHPAPGA